MAHYTCSLPEGQLPESEKKIIEVWKSLPLSTAMFYCSLDKFTDEDEFFNALGWGIPERKLMGAGLARVGQLIALPADEVKATTGLTGREFRRVERVIRRMGLSFGTDVGAWRAYRGTVAPDFRLMPPYGTRLPSKVERPRLD